MPEIKNIEIDGVIYDIKDETARHMAGGITNIDSTDNNNLVVIRDMASGTYVFYGRFKPYSGATSTLTFNSKLLVNVIKQSTESHVMVFYPVNNCVQYLKVTDDTYERKNVYLNDLMESVGTLSDLETKSQTDLVSAINEIARTVADLKYEAISITGISNNATGSFKTASVLEKGSSIDSVTINWSLNKEPASQTLDGETLANDVRSKTLTGLAMTENRTFRLTVTDERGALDTEPATTISFVNGVYYGVLAEDATLDSAAILTLNRSLQSTKSMTFTANPGSGERIAYALPTKGYGTPVFNVGGFEGGFTKAATLDFTNASGHQESYDVWLSDNSGLGSTTVKVS